MKVSHVSLCKCGFNLSNYMGYGAIVFNGSFNNISAILWWLVLLMEETRVPGENHRPAISH